MTSEINNPLQELFSPCRLCPHSCGALRHKNERGLCGQGKNASVALRTVHRGEEPPISGHKGSGTIFFNGCSLGCLFCQNHQISRCDAHQSSLQEVSTEELAETMLSLQRQGVHNINFVTPTHFAPHMVAAIKMARAGGLSLPVVYNTSGFDTLEVIRLLRGYVDIYMPDIKWLTPRPGLLCAGNLTYHEGIMPVIAEMYDQVGPLALNEEGVATGGLLIRHLVLPGGLSDSFQLLEQLAPLISLGVGISLMAQYHPHGEGLPEPLHRTITGEEYYPLAYELRSMKPPISFIQDLESHGILNPDFSKPCDDVFS
ncbi:radical SAM protein [Myxococcota bacterium]|nr:radical SAM protein [Myxococcota bacterium]MBU1533979.1 radical SAM protein [Myxococcota bacterium]